ncbi:MAG: SOS response-associated peptidase [Corynebacterium sp.]|nr:SOS response-associated peptidase [Corynebacterium sp.]
MCGRYVLFTTGDDLIRAASEVTDYRELYAPHGTPPARYNIAPTQTIPIVHSDTTVADDSVGILDPARWGLVPAWRKDLNGPTLFNARSETVTEKPSFRSSFTSLRCAIPMDGYYEWKDKQPHFVRREDGQLLWAAGVYSTGNDAVYPGPSATILTTAAAAPLEWLHERMPRFLDHTEITAWLTGGESTARELLTITPESLREKLVTSPASSRVGNVRNDDADLLGSEQLPFA